MAEFARHYEEQRVPALARARQQRALYRLDVQVLALIDLRRRDVQAALGLVGDPRVFFDRSVARATARFVRATTPAEAVLVPSLAFLDDPERWNLVLFLEKWPRDLAERIAVTPAGTLTLD